MKKKNQLKDEKTTKQNSKMKIEYFKGAPRKFFSPVMRKMRTKTVLSQAEDNN